MPHQILVRTPSCQKQPAKLMGGGWWHGPLEKLSVVVPRHAMVHSSLQAKDSLQPSQNGRMLHDQIFWTWCETANICKPSQTHYHSQRGPFFFKKHMEQFNFYYKWHKKLLELDLCMDPPQTPCTSPNVPGLRLKWDKDVTLHWRPWSGWKIWMS